MQQPAQEAEAADSSPWEPRGCRWSGSSSARRGSRCWRRHGGFGGVISEVGASIMVGEIKGYTRVSRRPTVMGQAGQTSTSPSPWASPAAVCLRHHLVLTYVSRGEAAMTRSSKRKPESDPRGKPAGDGPRHGDLRGGDPLAHRAKRRREDDTPAGPVLPDETLGGADRLGDRRWVQSSAYWNTGAG